MHPTYNTVCMCVICECLQMILKTEKQHKMDNREMYMLHRLDVQRLTGKKSK